MSITENKRNIYKGALSLSLSAILVKIVGVVYKIPIFNILGEEGMGYFNSAYTLYGFFFIICSSGIPKAITMVVADIIAAGEGNKAPGFMKRVIRLFLLFSIILSVFLFVLSPCLAHIIGNSKAAFSIMAIMPSLIFITLGGVMRGYLNGVMEFGAIAASQVIEAILKLAFGLGFAYVGSVLGLRLNVICALSVFGITLSTFFACLYLIIRYKKKNKAEKARQKICFETKGYVRSVLKIALPITLGSSMLALSNVVDLALIMHRLSSIGYTEAMASAAYGNYTTLAVPMLNLIISLITPISVAILPRLRVDAALGEFDSFKKNLKEGLTLCTAIGSFSFFLFSVYSFEFLDILFKRDAAQFGAPLLFALSPSILMLTLSTVLNTALEALGKIKLAVTSTLIGTLVKLICGYFLIGIPSVNILGAPLGTVLSSAVSLLFSVLFISRERCGKGVLSGIFLPIFFSFLSVYPTFFLKTKIFGGEKSIALCIIFCILSTLLYLILLLKSGIFSKYMNFLGKKRQNY